FLQALRGELLTPQIDAVLGQELLGTPVHDRVVEVFAAEERVTGGREHLEYSVPQLEERNVERATTEVVDGDRPRAALVEAIGQGGGGRLVDDALDVEPCDAPGVFRRLALRVVEV